MVTGSTSGIGLACAERLVRQHVSVIVTGLVTSADDVTDCLQRLARAAPSDGSVKVDFVPADLSKPEEIRKMCDDVIKLYPEGIDILINNAGLNFVHEVDGYPDDKWNEMIAVMLTAPFRLTKFFLPFMKHKGFGRIVNMSSQLGLVSQPRKAVYSAAKFGLIGLTKGVALEVAAAGITCNAVCPGFTRAPVFEEQIRQNAAAQHISIEQAEKHVTDAIPTHTMNTVEQVAELVTFLCLSDASSQMTGATYNIDQGYTAQ